MKQKRNKRPPAATVRQHILSPQHGLDRVKLNLQIGPLGSFDRADGELLAHLWNVYHGYHAEEVGALLAEAIEQAMAGVEPKQLGQQPE